MAVTAPVKTGDFAGFLTPTQAAPIFDAAARSSVVQQLAQRVPLGPNGAAVPVLTGTPTAGWVAEGAEKPATSGSLALVTMAPKKIAAIVPVSAEVVRADPAGYVAQMRAKLAEAFAVAFDAAALHGTATPFARHLDETAKAVELGTTEAGAGGAYGDLVAALKLLVDDGKKATGWALDDRAEPTLLGAVDAVGRPLFVEAPMVEAAGPVRAGRLVGRPAYVGPGVHAAAGGVVGYVGDWGQTAWGTVGGIAYDVSTEAAVTINGALVSAWENNLVLIRAEAEYGWLVNDTAAFVKITDAA